jgi:hypothetical protein
MLIRHDLAGTALADSGLSGRARLRFAGIVTLLAIATNPLGNLRSQTAAVSSLHCRNAWPHVAGDCRKRTRKSPATSQCLPATFDSLLVTHLDHARRQMENGHFLPSEGRLFRYDKLTALILALTRNHIRLGGSSLGSTSASYAFRQRRLFDSRLFMGIG